MATYLQLDELLHSFLNHSGGSGIILGELLECLSTVLSALKVCFVCLLKVPFKLLFQGSA